MGNDVQKPLTQDELKTREIQRVDREMRRKMGRGGVHYNSKQKKKNLKKIQSESCYQRRQKYRKNMVNI